jgi:hypothetical protein
LFATIIHDVLAVSERVEFAGHDAVERYEYQTK